jgi:hypothetical protein
MYGVLKKNFMGWHLTLPWKWGLNMNVATISTIISLQIERRGVRSTSALLWTR